MAILTRDKLASYGVELLVVVFGILIAFQVDEWREDRQRSRNLDAALNRLAEETAGNLQYCEQIIPVQAQHAQSVLTVARVLNDGRLDDEDVEAFEAGLTRVGYVTGGPYSTSVAAEMIATGLLKDLDNAELRNRVAELPVWIDGVRNWDHEYRNSLGAAVAEVAEAVDLELPDDFEMPAYTEGPATGFEDSIRVRYVFEELVANRSLKNVFIEAADTHLDMWRNHQGVCRKLEGIRASLSAMNRR